jgi:hypothetical protein
MNFIVGALIKRIFEASSRKVLAEAGGFLEFWLNVEADMALWLKLFSIFSMFGSITEDFHVKLMLVQCCSL